MEQRPRVLDPEISDGLASAHYAALCAFIRRYVPTQEDVEDLSQQALLRACARVSTYRGRSSFQTWLFSIARRLITDYYRDPDYAHRVKLHQIGRQTETLAITESSVATICVMLDNAYGPGSPALWKSIA